MDIPSDRQNDHPASTPTANVIVQRGSPVVRITPPCAEVLQALNLVKHELENRKDHGCEIGHVRTPLFRVKDPADLGILAPYFPEPYAVTFDGLEPVVRQLLTAAGRDVRSVGGRPELPPPDFYYVQDPLPFDDGLLATVRQHDRAVIQYDIDSVNPAWLIAQIALAWMNLSIVVSVARIDEARWLGRQLRRWLGDLTVLTGDGMPERAGRVVVGTYMNLGAGCVGIERRDIYLAANAREVMSYSGRLGLDRAHSARIYGMLPCNESCSPGEWTKIRCYFGFGETEVPRHGFRRLPVDVVWQRIEGGPTLPSKMKLIDLKRQGVWSNPVRNRQIVRLAKTLTSGNRDELVARYPAIAAVLQNADKPRVAIFVDAVEHAADLAKLIPDWSVLVPDDLSTRGMSHSAVRALRRAGRLPSPGTHTIITANGPVPNLAEFDVLIRADAGVALPAVPADSLIIPSTADHTLLLVDYSDRRHKQLRKMANGRQAAYRRCGWHKPGADPIAERVQEFIDDLQEHS